LGGYPHEKEVVDWLQQAAPQAKLQDIRSQINAMRQIKSPGELAFLQRAIDLSLDAHLEAMRMMRRGYTNIRSPQKWWRCIKWAAPKPKATLPLSAPVPIPPRSTTIRLSRKMEDGDIVVLDVGAQYSGYSADITRTLP